MSITRAMVAASLVTCCGAGAEILAQTPSAPGRSPAFEVASIKRNVSGSDNASVRGQPGGRLAITNTTLRTIIRNVYRLQGFQIAGGPDWIDTDRWDIVAKADGDALPDQLMAMVQTLLADRFRLAAHREVRDAPIYALTLSRSDERLGPQLRPSTVDCAALIAAARARGGAQPPTTNGRPSCGLRVERGFIMTTATTMADLARNLAPMAGRSVIDKTSLTGTYDLDLRWTPDGPAGDAPGGVALPGDDAVSLFTAMKEQLGLKLEAQRAPIEVLVIDSAERPIED
jgi:uncharacterized protein (TIGR03435 family)